MKTYIKHYRPETPIQVVWAMILRRKILIISTFVILFFLPIAYLTTKYQSKTEAAWMNDQWGYRQTVAITNAGTSQTDFQVAITLNTSALVTAGKMQSDCDDIRVTDISGKMLPYWISSCNNASTKIWPKVPSIPTSGTIIYLYYGNPSAQSAKVTVGTQTYPGLSCKSILDAGNSIGNGTYWVDTTNGSSSDKQQVYCDMTSNSGGWMLVTPSMVDSFSELNVTKVSATDANGGAIYSYTHTTTGCGGPESGATVKITNSIQWDVVKVKESYNNGTSSCWSTNGDGNYGGQQANSNMQAFAPGTDTLQNCILSCSTSPYVMPPMVRCDGAAENFTRFNSASQRSFEAIIRRTNRTTLSGPALGLSCNSLSMTSKFENIYIRENSLTYATLSVGAPSNEQKSLGPVAYWKFDEGYGTNANNSTQVSGINGTLGTNASWKTEDECISGKCIYIDDSGSSTWQTVIVNDNSSLGDMSALTVGIWIKTVSIKGTQQVVYKRNSTGTPAWSSYQIQLNSLKPTFYVTNSSATTVSAQADTAIELNKWYYLTGVYDGSQVQIYVNGTAADSSPASLTGNVLDSNYRLMVGGLDTASSYYVKGYLDDLKIYSYARSAAQIKSDFASKGSGSVKGTSAALGVSSKNSDAFSNGLVGYWKMDEVSGAGSTLADSSGNSNTGTAVLWGGGNTSTDSAHVAGKFGNSFSFDGGDDYITPASSIVMTGAGSTLSLWFKVNAFGGMFVGKAADNDTYIYPSNSTTINVQTDTISTEKTFTVPTMSTGTWYHLVVTRDNNTTHVYLNGTESTSGGQSQTPDLTINQFGRYSNYAGYWYNGMLDELRLYNRALSPKEVRDLYAWAPGPVGYWKLDEKTGTTAYDSSGNGFNSSSFTGSPIWKLGKFGSSLDFTGTNKYISIPTMTGKYSSMLTVSAWVYHTTSANWDDIVAGGCGDILFGFSNNQLNFGGQCNSPFGMLGYTTNINNGWHYVTGTYDSSMARLYVDGVQVNSIARSGSFTPSAIQISRTGEDFQGQIDDVKIYNYARNSKQIVEDMNAGHPVGGSPVGSQFGYWKFDEGYGTTVNNQISGQPNFTFANAPNDPTWDNNGKFGKTVYFDGALSVTSEDYADATYTAQTWDDGTLSVWIKPDSIPAAEYYPISDYNGVVGESGGWLVAVSSNGGCSIRGNASYNSSCPANTFQANQWTHIAWVVSKTQGFLKTYANGKLINTVTGNTLGFRINTTLRVGMGSWCGTGSDCIFPGFIDEVKIYSSALTSDEIALDYNRGASMVLGTMSDTSGLSGGSIASSSATASYCVPGGTDSCSPPVGEWKMDEKTGANAYDTSGSGNVGTITGATWTTGKMGASLNFDGNDDNVNAGSGSTLQLTSTGTVSLWFKATTAFSGAQAAQKHLMSGGPRDFYFSNSSSKLFYFLSDDATYAVSDSGSWDTNWHFVVAASDGTTVKMYIDGVLQTTTGSATGKNFFGNTGALTIGRSTLSFPGKIDQARIFNYARTPAQIAYDYNRGGPVAHWKFDECQGITANDSSGNGNSGTITIGATVPQSSVGTCTVVDTATAWYNGATGKYNSSLNFDGVDDWVNAGQVLATDQTKPFTFSTWAKAASGGMGTWRTIVGTNTSFAQLAFSSSNDIRFGQNGGGGWWQTGSSIVADTWYHVIGIYDGTNARLYVNGNLVSGPTARTFTSAHGVTVMGRYQTGGGEWMNGQIDDVRIYNYALTPQQIKSVFNQGSGIRFGPLTGSP